MSMSIKRLKELFPKEADKLLSSPLIPKYRAQKVEVNGRHFDSKKEASYSAELDMLAKQGKIDTITYQPEYILQPKFKKNGKSYRLIRYIADFEVLYTDGHVEIIDVKGFKTPIYKLKQKMFEWKYPNKTIKEI